MKNQRIKVATVALVGMLFASNGMTAKADVFDDILLVPGWAHEHISWAKEQDIVVGKANNCFDADGLVTRAEAATMMVKFKQIDVEKYDTACEQFEDVGDKWYTKYINAAYANDLISGKTETTFDPEGQLSRAEAAALIVSAMDYELEVEEENAFTDIEGHWYTDYINTAYTHKIVAGKSEGGFQPNEDVTRAEIVTMLHATVREGYEVGWIAKFSIYGGHGTFVLTDANGRTLNYDGVDEEGEYLFSGELVETTEIRPIVGYGISQILLENMEGSESFTFDPFNFGGDGAGISFRGRNNYAIIEGSNIDKITVNADGTIYLYGTDMEYRIMFGNTWDTIDYSGTSASDVALKVVDGQFVVITE